MKIPVYLMISKSYVEKDPIPYRVAAAINEIKRGENSLLQLRFELDVDDALLQGVIDTQQTLTIAGIGQSTEKIRASLTHIIESP